jgi:hypothetical protein
VLEREYGWRVIRKKKGKDVGFYRKGRRWLTFIKFSYAYFMQLYILNDCIVNHSPFL